jgi:hypothetical protein
MAQVYLDAKGFVSNGRRKIGQAANHRIRAPLSVPLRDPVPGRCTSLSPSTAQQPAASAERPATTGHPRLLRPHPAAPGCFTSAPDRWEERRTRFTGPRPPEDGQRRRRELSGSGDEEGGHVYRICGSRSLAAFLDHGGEELHFCVAIWVVGWRIFCCCTVSQLTYFEF